MIGSSLLLEACIGGRWTFAAEPRIKCDVITMSLLLQEKLALGPGVDPELVNLSFPIKHNLKWIARSLEKPIR